MNSRLAEPLDRAPLPKNPRILVIDNDRKGRKARINILKAHGFSAYPALNMQQAKTRCKPGSFDLIVVNSSDEKELALEFCDTIKQADPRQFVLLMTAAGAEAGDRDYLVSDDPQLLLERVQALFPARAAEVPAAA